MPSPKTADAIKLVLRLSKGLHRQLVQRAKRNNVSLNTEIINELEAQGRDDSVIARAIEDAYMLPLSEIGLWSPEYARIRQEGGHPPLPPEIVSALRHEAKKAKVTPEELWKAKLRENGIDPDAPYMAPAMESAAA
jgi:HicB-like protein involved in pilus formation